ncbi:MAG: SpoIIE family protein phosphatase [Acidobacteriota bacterium]|nr:SpoIIE family protein phosphatase [Acidobacteriota bacterium]
MPPPPPSRPARELLLGTRTGRVFLGATAVKLLLLALGSIVAQPPAFLDLIGIAASLLIVITATMFVTRAMLIARRQLLWHVRRKLVVSYVFIGLVPALLLLVFFLFGGQIVFMTVASYLFNDGYRDVVERAAQVAQSAANDVAREPGRAQPILERFERNLSRDYPGFSMALIPIGSASGIEPMQAGPWRHLPAPQPPLPLALRTAAYQRTVVLRSTVVCRTDDGSDKLIIRAVAHPEGNAGLFVAVVDVPVGQELFDDLKTSTRITARGVTASHAGPADKPITPQACGAGAEPSPPGDIAATLPFRYDRSASFLDYVDWETQQPGQVTVGLRVRLRDLYAEITKDYSVTVSGRTRPMGEAMAAAVLLIGVLFVIIEFAALVMGLALARSITTAVHDLFTGTERVRQGDFTHRIQVTAADQLGQLSDSFNQMSSGIEHLLQQVAEKRRMEEELRIAREIQMSLLPSGSLEIPGIRMTALCVPAREVGGDYYDFFQLSPRRFSLLIADVSGKGTSAALYMAELKGLLLALSKTHQSPRDLLIEVNHILSDHLDTRSFITMTYAIIDLDLRTMVFARAGHTPLIYVPADPPAGEARRAQVLAPDGMVLGLRVPNIERLFPHHLTEQSLPLRAGDVLVLYTDGISEAMNEAEDLFGEGRLAQIIEQHAHLDSPELRERILREVEAFTGPADQHDDMTMILIKIEEPGAHLPPVHTEGAVEV